MKATHGHRNDVGNIPQSAWSRFWFQPTDPTALGFIRIVTGLLVIYVHLAYCYDFQAFFGPHGYWDRHASNTERREYPTAVGTWNWEADRPAIQTPQFGERRVAVFDFLKHLPEQKQEREETLRYLYVLLEQGSRGELTPEANFHVGLGLLSKIAKDEKLDSEEDRAKVAAILGSGERYVPLLKERFKIALPDFFVQLKSEERVRLWNGAIEFVRNMPSPEAGANFDFILDWLKQMAPSDRQRLATWLHELPDGPESRKITSYYDTWRVDPRILSDQGRSIFSLWYHVTDPAAMWVCHSLILVVFVLFTIGFCTRVTSVMAWLGALFYIHRTQQVLFGMDSMMNALLLYLMIGPSGAALSVDRLIARYRASRALFKAGGQSVPWAEAVLAGPRPSALANLAIRMLQIHFCFIYASSGLSKLKGGAWWNTSATWDTMANPDFTPIHFRAYEWVLFQIASIRPLLMVVFMFAAYFTLFLEIGLPFLIWSRFRPVMACLGIFFHAGIACIMGLVLFGLLMMTMLLGFVPSAVIRDRLLWSPGTGPKLTLRYSSRNPRNARLVGFLRAFDLTGQIVWIDDGAKNSETPVQSVGGDGRIHTGYDLVEVAFGTLVFMRALSWALWIPGVALAIRRFIGDSREATHPIAITAEAGSRKTPTAR